MPVSTYNSVSISFLIPAGVHGHGKMSDTDGPKLIHAYRKTIFGQISVSSGLGSTHSFCSLLAVAVIPSAIAVDTVAALIPSMYLIFGDKSTMHWRLYCYTLVRSLYIKTSKLLKLSQRSITLVASSDMHPYISRTVMYL